jgi:acetyl-CoA carboxylase carboxyltransferase component
MVGPQAETQAQVRHVSRMFLAAAHLRVPCFAIVLRKGYGLGAQAMAGGGFKAGLFCVGWPTSEFGAMGLEGAVRLGMRRELEAIEDPQERDRAFQATVTAAYERGEGINMAAYFEIDDVIDPADSDRWIDTLFSDDSGRWWTHPGKRRPNVDAW